LDNTQQQVSLAIEQAVASAYEAFALAALNATGVPAYRTTSPVRLEPPVYGSPGAQFVEFIAPGMTVGVRRL
jgi:hypothetical protein